MVIANQGYIKNLDLSETTQPALALANLAGATIPDDLKLIQNNLRNISTIGYSTFSEQHFQFPELDFVFTDNDIVQVSKDVSIGSTTLNTNSKYFICSSDGKSKFKISTTSKTVGFTTFDVLSVDQDNFNIIRNDTVSQDNIINLINPSADFDEENLDLDIPGSVNFLTNSIFGSGTEKIKNAFEIIQNSVEITNLLISKKYNTDRNINTSEILKYEGILKSSDPANLNVNVQGLQNSSSPGFYIGTIRAFSSGSNPWTKDTNAGQIETTSTSVKINELFFYDELRIEGINVTSATSTDPNDFTHKLPIEIYGETYYLLLKQ